ncbi:MAG: PD40 domain-containing protein [Anaerolineales bacterium]|nr:PD40 domain-containing protein [Chloroflexota bacterium]MBL6980172.1 PD40 domain-containing protein [Anaerolineales bacterium]
MKIQILLILTLIGTILSAPMEAETPTEPEDVESLVVFASNRGDDPNALGLYILDTETLEITPLETDFDANLFPKWSPDGEQVLFTVPGEWNLYTILADGTEITQITDFRSANADWAPDGSQIVFQSDHDDEPEDTPDVYVIDLVEETLVELVDLPEVPDFSPRWSPDGSQIMFISARTGNFEIFLMNPDGTDPIQITDSSTPIFNAAWSPDGEQIAYPFPTGEQSMELFLINKDGSPDSIVQLTEDDEYNTSPAWSPDGEKIVFRSDRGGNPDLWMINVDGTDLVQLTDDEYYDDFPDWGPKNLFEFEIPEE